MSTRTTVAADLAKVAVSHEVVVRVLLTTGHTVQGDQYHVRPDGLVQMQALDGDGLAIILDPAHVVASYVPETAEAHSPWSAR